MNGLDASTQFVRLVGLIRLLQTSLIPSQINLACRFKALITRVSVLRNLTPHDVYSNPTTVDYDAVMDVLELNEVMGSTWLTRMTITVFDGDEESFGQPLDDVADAIEDAYLNECRDVGVEIEWKNSLLTIGKELEP